MDVFALDQWNYDLVEFCRINGFNSDKICGPGPDFESVVDAFHSWRNDKQQLLRPSSVPSDTLPRVPQVNSQPTEAA